VVQSEDNFNNKKSNLKMFLKKNVISIIFLFILTSIVSLITYYRILVQFDIGPVFDSFVFLSNALVFAGHSTGYSELLRPPLFSFIISLIFRLGYVSANTIFVVDGILFVFGAIGLYMLFKLKFNDLESFLGGLLYATFPIVLTYLGFGFSDLASVSFSIWAIYSMVLAVKKDSRFFYLAFPFAMFAFLTRYNSGLLIFPIFLYILMNRDKINIKNFFSGIMASFVVILPVFIFFYEKFGNIIYPFINFGSSSTGVSVSTISASYNPNIFYFVQMFPAYTGIQTINIILIMILVSVLFLFSRYILKGQYKNWVNYLSLKGVSKIKWVLFVVIGILFIASFGKTVYIVSEIIFFVLSYQLYDLIRNRIKSIDLHIMFLSWFMAFFIFSSVFVIKDDRYFLLMAPAVSYFMILILSKISNKVNFKIRNINIVFPIIAIILTSFILLSTVNEIPNILHANNDELIANQQIELASQWFANYDPNYKNQNIYSDLSPNFSWYLKTDVKQMPVFKNNQTFINVNNNSFTQKDSNDFNRYLVANNVDYYLCIRQGLNLTSYIPIKQIGSVIIYKRN
jgi:4-amino-4-deoxy-L-arabinose transferase-like glycosyltransferase